MKDKKNMFLTGKNLSALILILVTSLFAENAAPVFEGEDSRMIVATRIVPPFVIKEADGSYSGLTVELWDHIASELGFDYIFEETDIQGMLEGVEEGRYMAAASALTITSSREETVDFSHPFYVTGLGIAVSYQPSGFLHAVFEVFSLDFLLIVFLLLGLLFFWGFLVWVFERKNNKDDFGGTSAQGIGSGIWWAAVTMTTVGYGDKAPKTFAGRVVGFIWMFTAIITVSFFTASIASTLTVSQLDSRVNGLNDLPHVRTGALAHSAALVFLDDNMIRATPFPTIEDGLRAVAEGEIDAFVHDAPIIRYFAGKDFRNKVQVLPNTFNDQYYGIALPLNSDLRNPINKVLLDYITSDEWKSRQEYYTGN